LAAALVRRLGVAQALDARLDLLQSHRPFTESGQTHPVYGDQKEGADFSYKGPLAYPPRVISLAETQECLRLINRSGNTPSAEGAGGQLTELFPMLLRRFRQVVVRGDSAFCNQTIFEVCEAHRQFFAVVSPTQTNFEALADALAESAWKPYRPARSRQTYRLVIRRQRIAEYHQGELFELWRYRYVMTNLPASTSIREVVDLTYQRCDQENVIEQLQHGVAGMRMPTGGLLSNAAFLTCARMAHNLKAWRAQLAWPRETMRWQWKRFRHAFVYKPRPVYLRLFPSDPGDRCAEKLPPHLPRLLCSRSIPRMRSIHTIQ